MSRDAALPDLDAELFFWRLRFLRHFVIVCSSLCTDLPCEFLHTLSEIPINLCLSHRLALSYLTLATSYALSHSYPLTLYQLQTPSSFAVTLTPGYASILLTPTSLPLQPKPTMTPGERSTSSRKKPNKQRPNPATTQDFRAAVTKLDYINTIASSPNPDPASSCRDTSNNTLQDTRTLHPK